MPKTLEELEARVNATASKNGKAKSEKPKTLHIGVIFYGEEADDMREVLQAVGIENVLAYTRALIMTDLKVKLAVVKAKSIVAELPQQDQMIAGVVANVVADQPKRHAK